MLWLLCGCARKRTESVALCLEKPLGGRVVQRLGHVLLQQLPMLTVPELVTQEGFRVGKR